MSASVRILVIGLAFATLTAMAAPGKPKFNPDEALGFLETLSTIKDGKPDVNLLAKLFEARYSPGAGDVFVEAVEAFVGCGCIAAGRADLWSKRVKPKCSVVDVSDIERNVTKECNHCRGGKARRPCTRCDGDGKCNACRGRGLFGNFPAPVKCGSCDGTGCCPVCNGRGNIPVDCPNCGGKGRVVDSEKAFGWYATYALRTIKGLCEVGETTDMPDLLKRDFKVARENAVKRFPVLLKMWEEEEMQAKAEEERREKAELERQEKARQDAFEAEQRGNGNVADIKVKCYLRLNNGNTVALRGSAMLERNSDILNVFRAGMEASRLVKLRKSECELAKAEQRQALDKDPFSAKPYTDALMQAVSNLDDAQRSLEQVEGNLHWRLKKGETTFFDNLTFAIRDVPIGVRYTLLVYGLYGSQRIFWAKSIRVDSKDGLEMVLTNDIDCLIPDYGD